MEALGKEFNVIPVADAVEVNMRDCAAVTFICVFAGTDTFTLKEARDAAGTGVQNLAVIDNVYTNVGSAGANPWVREQPAASAAVTTAAGKPVAVFTVEDSQLSDGFTHVRVDSTGAGTVVAVAHGLTVQRAPANLPALGV